jgi:hypothetical protein
MVSVLPATTVAHVQRMAADGADEIHYGQRQ